MILHDLINKNCKSETRKIFFIYGGVETRRTREEVRQIIESETDAIVIASYGTFSTGINIKSTQCHFCKSKQIKRYVIYNLGRV